MRIVRNILIGLGVFISALFLIIYSFQEKLIFHPESLPLSYTFNFDASFEEIYIEAEDKSLLNGLLFKADSTRGIIFYLHGNAGSLKRWGNIASTYTELNYDLFILDYRGFGKSQGKIESEEQLFSDVQRAYSSITSAYANEEKIIIGYSIGTGPAAWLASQNNPDLLILQAPYYSLLDMKDNAFPLIPDFLLKYPFETYRYIENVSTPILIFHGDKDGVINYQSSIHLSEHFKEKDQLITLKNAGHNGMSDNQEYRDQLKEYLQTNFPNKQKDALP